MPIKSYRAVAIFNEQNIKEVFTVMLIKHCPQIELIGVATSWKKGCEILQTADCHAVFLSRDFFHHDCFDRTGKNGRPPRQFISIDDFQDYVLQSLLSVSLDKLLAPVDPSTFSDTERKVIPRLSSALTHDPVVHTLNEPSVIAPIPSDIRPLRLFGKKIVIAEQFGFRILNTGHLVYLEADGNYTRLHMQEQSSLLVSQTLGDFERLLDPGNFFRIHKSTMINIHHLEGFSNFEGNYAVLAGGIRLNISRRRLKKFKETILLRTL